MKRTTPSLRRWTAAGLFAVLLAFSAVAVAEGDDEIEAPASDLPEAEGEADGEAPVDEGAGGTAIDATQIDAPASKPALPAEQDADNGETMPATWESYGDPTGGGSVAEEITGGVRVEDIVEPPADYRYAAFGKPDPFVPPMVTEDSSVDPLEIPIVSPLQRFQLGDLSLVGVWQLSSGERKAMVMTPEGEGGGQGIIVKNGDPIANRGGKILSVGDDYLTVREFTLAPDGTRQFEDRQLFMGKRTEDSGKLRFTPGSKETQVIQDTSGSVIYGTDAPSANAVGPSAAAPATGSSPAAAQQALPAAAAGTMPANGAAALAPANAAAPVVPVNAAGLPPMPAANATNLP